MMRFSGLWLGLGMVVALGALGCDGGETATAGAAGTGGAGGSGGSGGSGGGPVCPDDPSWGAIDPTCGVWVSASLGNDANEGTQAEPVASLTHAIELAEKGAGRVYACGETWTEALMVPSGVSLYGGFDCGAGWAYVGPEKRSAVISPSAPRPIALTWFYNWSMKEALLVDFLVQSADATEPGGSSIACFVRDDVPIHMLRTECSAGNGADGVDGEPADVNGEPAMAGMPGNDGADACSAVLSPGGAAVEGLCDSTASKGGAGGNSSAMIAANGADGEPAGDLPGGAGGLGAQMAISCTAGSPGANGADGADGEGWPTHSADGGRLTAEGHVSAVGEQGDAGAPGQGGGGGGATFGSAAVCGASSGGAAGGSGGTGGCGGKGGKPGQFGGASFALASRGSQVLIQNVTLRSGNGGNGGNGGAPQMGGAGGKPGNGGKGMGSIQAGCAGGMGGNGGKGGYGTGGAGGWSAQVAWANAPVLIADDLQIFGGEGGKGGEGNPAKVASWGANAGQRYSLPVYP